jgi:23S rRNA (uracil1939-C5)-methyltransferase
VKEYLNLQGREKVLDAYCGVGSIALNIAAQAAKVIGIEANEQAVEDARHNAELNHIDNCEFIAGLCEEVLKDRKYEFDAVVLDPPRAGLKKEVIQALIEAEPERIVYVSCNPSTLARDLKLLTADKYSVSQIQPLDMFPRTSHVETVVLITRVKE